MEPNKTQFHEEMGKWESDFADFKKNVFPKNYGAMVRKYLSVFLIIMSMMMFYCAMANGTDVNFALFTISPVMFMLGVVLRRKQIVSFLFHFSEPNESEQRNAITTANYLNLQKQISTAENNYSMYPDVMEYLKQFKTSVEAEQRHKKRIERNFWFVFWGFFLIFGLIQYYTYIQSRKRPLCNYDFCNALEFDKEVPFLILEPYKTNIDDSITLKPNKISVYLAYTTERDKENEEKSGKVRYLRAESPIVLGGTGYFRLTITDESGNPIPRCPCFVFHSNSRYVIDSEYFLYTPKASDDLSDLQTLETLRYLQANQEHLRFIVEKI